MHSDWCALVFESLAVVLLSLLTSSSYSHQKRNLKMMNLRSLQSIFHFILSLYYQIVLLQRDTIAHGVPENVAMLLFKLNFSWQIASGTLHDILVAVDSISQVFARTQSIAQSFTNLRWEFRMNFNNIEVVVFELIHWCFR